MIGSAARKFHVAVVGAAATVAVAFLPVDDPWPTVAQAITGTATAFGVYWARNAETETSGPLFTDHRP